MDWKEEIHNANSLTDAGFVAEECYKQTGREYTPEDTSYIWFHGRDRDKRENPRD
jgi:hypothetical protein